jgi:hypothetical protein
VDGDPVNPAHHIARQCNKSAAPDGIPQGTAFLLRENEHDLSVNELEASSMSADRYEQLRAVKAALIASNRRVLPNQWFAVLGVADVTSIEAIQDLAVVLSVIQTPKPTNVGHASVYGLPIFGTDLARLAGLALAERARHHAAVQVRDLEV